MRLFYVPYGVQRYKTLAFMLAKFLNCDVEELNEYSRLERSDLLYPWYFFNECLYPDNLTINPPFRLAQYWNSKINQSKKLASIVKMPRYLLYHNKFELIFNLKKLKKTYDRFLITSEFGENGNSFLFGDGDLTLRQVFGKYDAASKIRATEFVDVTKNVGIHTVIANKREIYISPIVEQLLSGTFFRGGSYPANISLAMQEKVKEEAYRISEYLCQEGYLGLCQMDFMICGDQVFLAEINPRKAGSTICLSCMMERLYNYSLPALEFFALTEKSLPEVKEMRSSDIAWELRYLPFQIDAGSVPGDEAALFKSNSSGQITYNETHSKWSYQIKVLLNPCSKLS